MVAAQGHQLLPWQSEVWDQLAPTLANERLTHALLITGPPGVGKRQLAQVLAAAILCGDRDASQLPCGTCKSCVQLAARAHPDAAMLTPEEGKREIRVDQVREFSRTLYLTPQYGTGRVGLIDAAERLNVHAGNSLLKTLEEPPAGSHLVLLSERTGGVLPTVRSRCQILRVPLPAAHAVQDWLSERPPGVAAALPLARGAPLRANELAEAIEAGLDPAEWLTALAGIAAGERDPLAVAADWDDDFAPIRLEWLYLLAGDLLKRQSRAPATSLAFAEHASRVAGLAAKMDTQRLRRLVPRIARSRVVLPEPCGPTICPQRP